MKNGEVEFCENVLAMLTDREGFRRHVIETLARTPVDYVSQFQLIFQRKKSEALWAGGGILLPLYFEEDPDRSRKLPGKYFFLLNKRSRDVQQPGDLCAPGGGIHPFMDSLSGKLLRFRLLPGIGGAGLALAKTRGEDVYEKILLVLANALRESWEELRLSPFNVEFLGPLPSYGLHSRQWIIFPLVGRVKHAWRPKLSWEVEKIVSISLEAFFDPANYALYSLEVAEKLVAAGIPNPWEFPCFVHRENGQEEILWGATLNVIASFFEIVFGFSFPSPDPCRVIRRPLPLNYFSGREIP